MTLNHLFANHTLPVMGEPQSSNENYKDYLLAAANAVCLDCLAANNSLRTQKGLSPLTGFATITDLSDEIPFEPEILINVLPYGIGARLLLDDVNAGKTNFLEQNYEANLKKYTKAVYEKIAAGEV